MIKVALSNWSAKQSVMKLLHSESHKIMFFCLLWKGPIFEPQKTLRNKRPYAGISFLVFVLFRPCSSYLFICSSSARMICCFAAFLIFLHHILQNSCRLFVCLFSSYFSYFSGLACLLCSRTRYASISLVLPWLIAVVFGFLCLSLWPQNLYLSRMKNQHGHWGYCWCRWVERTV